MVNLSTVAVLWFVAVLAALVGLRGGFVKTRDLAGEFHVDDEAGADGMDVRPASQLADREQVTGLPFVARLEAKARMAGIRANGTTLVTLAVLSGAAAFTVVLALTNQVPLAALVSPIGLLAPNVWISREKEKRTEAFARQLDGALLIAASALRAGSSLAQAIEQVARDAGEPLSEEFAKADRAIKLGADPAAALAAVRQRVESPDLDLAVVATQILSRTGGNLAECYENIAEAVRVRRAFRQAVRAHTAQLRMSGTIVSLMPIGITLLIRMVNPRYFDPMLETTLGQVMFVGSFVLIGIGWLATRRVLGVNLE